MSAPASAGSGPTMRAVMLESYGKPASSHTTLSTVPIPTLTSPSHVLIKVLSAALNPLDGEIISGAMKAILPLTLPLRLGFDVAGTIHSVGSAVTKFKQGDAVYARVDHASMGTLADYVATGEGSVALKPSNLSFDEAAALPLVSLTALQALRDTGHLTAGQRVFITGGSGGVGTAAIQIARILGASEIVTTVSSDFNRSLTLGATRVIDKQDKFSDTVKDMDLVLDTTGEANSTFTTLKSGGLCVSIIAAILPHSMKDAGLEPSVTTQALLTAQAAPVQANAVLHSVKYDSVWVTPSGAELEEIRQWVEDGKLKPIIQKVYQLDSEYGQALDDLSDGHHTGKIVIHVADK